MASMALSMRLPSTRHISQPGSARSMPRRADAHLHADAAFLAIGGLGGEQGVDGGTGGLQRAADELYIAIDALDVVLRFLILPHLDQAEDHLQVVLEIMALGAQRAVQVLKLRIGVLKHFALAGDLAGVAGIADVQKRTPDHHKGHGADEQPLGHAGKVELAAKKGVEHQPHGKKRLRRVGGDGVTRDFIANPAVLEASFSWGYYSTGTAGVAITFPKRAGNLNTLYI